MAGEDAKDDGAHEVDGSAATIACVKERKRPGNCIPPKPSRHWDAGEVRMTQIITDPQ